MLPVVFGGGGGGNPGAPELVGRTLLCVIWWSGIELVALVCVWLVHVGDGGVCEMGCGPG